jgi:hypothetical protein
MGNKNIGKIGEAGLLIDYWWECRKVHSGANNLCTCMKMQK